MNTVTRNTINRNSLAFQMGAREAHAGEPCVPEMLFVRRQDQIDFAAGWESVNGVTITTAQFTNSPLPVPVAASVPLAAATAEVAPVKREHRTAEATAMRVINQLSKHRERVECMVAKTAAETPEAVGDILWAV